MNLLFKAILHSIEEVAKARGLRNYRVLYKRNAKKELVVALVISPDEPALGPDHVKI